MKEYEVIWEIFNKCPRNQMRDVFVDEVEIEDPEEYADEDRSFYDWHVQNGKGYEVEIDPELWKKGRKFLHVIREL